MLDKLKVLMCISLLAISACQKEDQMERVTMRYGLDFNKEREKIGLAELPLNWICLPPTPYGRYVWVDPSMNRLGIPSGGGYNAKVLLIKNDTLISETDEYVNSKFFNTPQGGIAIEYLLYIYQFVNYEEFIIGWDYYYSGDIEKGNRGYVTKSEADSILDSWKQNKILSSITDNNYE